MEFIGFFRTLRRHLLVVAALTILGLLIGAIAAAVITPTYQARATLFLRVQAASTSLYERSQFALQRVQSYPQLLESPSLLNQVISELNLPMSSQQLARRVSADNPTNTVLLNVTASAPTGVEAARIANAAARDLAANVNELENAETTSKNAVMLIPQISAQAPSSSSSPNVPLLLGLGLVGGFVLGALLALLLEATRPRVRTAADVRRVTGLPLVAQLPRNSKQGVSDRGQAAARSAAANLRALGRGSIAPVVLLAPAGRTAGNSLVRYVLAWGLAQTGRRVVVVETDGNAPMPRTVRIPDDSVGFSELLAGRVTAADATQSGAAGDVDVVPAGHLEAAPSPVQIERVFARTLRSVGVTHDVTVLQAASGGTPVDLAIGAPVAQGALIVVSHRWTTEHEVRRLLAQLRALEVVAIGVIMVDSPAKAGDALLESWIDDDFITIESRPAHSTESAAAPAVAPASAQPQGVADPDRRELAGAHAGAPREDE